MHYVSFLCVFDTQRQTKMHIIKDAYNRLYAGVQEREGERERGGERERCLRTALMQECASLPRMSTTRGP